MADLAIRPLSEEELETVDAVLPLSRLDSYHEGAGEYLVAWRGERPVGHGGLSASDPPELQDLWVLPEERGRGVGRALVEAAEQEALRRGARKLLMSVSERDERLRGLYEAWGFRDTGAPPHPVRGTIMLRGKPLEVDDVLLSLEKDLEARAA